MRLCGVRAHVHACMLFHFNAITDVGVIRWSDFELHDVFVTVVSLFFFFF